MTAFVAENKDTVLTTPCDDIWIMDSGASAHMMYKKEYFSEFRDVVVDTRHYYTVVKLGNNQTLDVKGVGTIRINKLINDEWHESTITDVLFIPELKKNLFSEGIITATGMKVVKEHYTIMQMCTTKAIA